MTDLASLSLRIDSTEVGRGVDELDKLTAAGTRTEAATNKAGKEWVKASSAAGQLRMAESTARMEAERMARSMTGAGAAASKMAAEAQMAAASMRNVTATAASQRAGMQQLGYQISDVGAQVASMGFSMSNVARVVAVQSSQVVQAIAMMRGSATGFIGFLSGPWGAAIMAGVSVLSILGAQALEAGDDMKAAAKAADELAEALERIANLDFGGADIDRLMKEANRLGSEASALERRANSIDPTGRSGFGGNLRKEAEELRKERDALIQQARTAMDPNNPAVRITQRNRDILNARPDRPDRPERDRKSALSEQERAYRSALAAAQDYRAGLADETAEIGKNAIELHAMRTEAAAAAAEKAALKAPTSAAAQALRDEAKAIRESETAWRTRTQAQANADFDTNVIRPLMDELELLGLVGEQRDLAALALEEESFKAKALRDGVTDVNDAWARYFAWNERLIKQESALEREAEQARALRQALEGVISTVSGLGGIGSGIGGLLGILTGNTGAVGGPVGQLLGITTGGTIAKTDERGNVRYVAETLGDKFSEVFRENGDFAKAMRGVLEGASTGLLAGNAFFGQQGTIGQLGSGIGGALGEALGEKFLTKGLESIFKGLGSAAGPLGAVLGGLLGGLAGSLFASTPKGGVTIGGVGGELGVVGTSGGNDARIAAATKSAGGIIEGLTQLADQLGASIDPSRGRVTVGMYKDNWRVSTSGNSRLGGYSGSESQNAANFGLYNFGQDAEAAALFAMQDLIRDGVLVGLRKGTETLLKNAKDLEAGVSKALAFEGVFRELDALKDPLGSALNDLTREFDRLRKIFAEAGASAAEYAHLEELLALKRQEVMDDEARRAVDKLSERSSLEVELLDLLGRKEEAVAQARQFELAGLEAALRPLQSMIYTLQDARAVMAQFEPLAADLRAFKQELLGGAGGAGGYAIAAARFRETAGLAKNGDADALGNLRTTATGFLDAARDNARSALEYQRAVGEVLGAVDNGIFAADSQIEYAQLQIDAIKANSAELLKVREQLATLMQQGNENTSALRRLWERYDGDGLTVKTDQDTPLQVEVI